MIPNIQHSRSKLETIIYGFMVIHQRKILHNVSKVAETFSKSGYNSRVLNQVFYSDVLLGSIIKIK